ncbi:cytochrome c biogenesis protein CcsA [Aquiflexum sp. TKW24L]|uniref:cytochrome c biogenesis protein n=1 Tax=Aquiflexum sp. TKW24L TaxID=2942212 RepID=UPI0020BD49E9|nr:cytochrome c biogenesis protein CcsA [Aquiflexum sp. TKW24L]MCL6260234.1 cytochrome c biogenesis protein CcsA [Aquiflexum sp. TKW24L]
MKIFKILLSTKVTLLLFIAFGTSMAVATFLENDHGTPVARSLVYNAWWFELIMVWMAVNFLAHTSQYKLFHKNRWPIGLFHISFVLIIIGAGVTRYISEEGIMHIRQGEEQSTFYTTSPYLQITQNGNQENRSFQKPLLLLSKDFQPKTISAKIGDSNFEVVFEDFIKGAKEEFLDGKETFIDLAVAMGTGREDFLIEKGKYIQMGEISLSTKNDPNHAIRIFKENDSWIIETDQHLQLMEMVTQQMGNQHAGESNPLQMRTLYQWEGGAFIVKEIHENAKLSYIAEEDPNLAKDLLDVAKYKVLDDSGKILSEAYVKMVSFNPGWSTFSHEGNEYAITYGPKPIHLPFGLYLNAFELERYPGSQSPASYASEVMVMDKGEDFPYRIFMNNVLDYKGFRFYQSSYDTDERGTVLSVNQDRPGTYITYLGYLLLSVGMFLTLFAKGSRFRILNTKLGNIKKTVAATLILFGISANLFAQEAPSIKSSIVPLDQAELYGRLVVQDLDGRMKPLNTLANEIVRKLSGKTYLALPVEEGEIRLSPEQFLLAVQMDPATMSQLPLVRIDKAKSMEVFQLLGKEPTDKISFQDFLDDEGNYRIQELVEAANLLKPAERNEGHKELLKTDERFNIFYGLLTGDFLRLFPNKLDNNNTWFTGQQYMQGFDEEDAVFVKNITPLYLSALRKGIEEGKWEDAEETLSYIALYQQKIGEEVYPSPNEIKAELLYNQLNLGTRLFGIFWLLGTIMLFLGIVMLFKDDNIWKKSWFVGKILTWLGFLAFTFHLGLRWYIAKHPPWSDGFEMLVFVAWGVLLFGLLFSNKSKFTLPLGLIFSGTLLFVGFLDWLNPEITNLMPVLNSYWLKIHVAIIVSSYAPLALAAIIALLSLILIIFKPFDPGKKWWSSIRELQMVNEMSITIGLFLLSVGTFLGGVWANESWGRYWAWDPKETWALISVIVYAFVLHLRLIPKFKNGLVFNLASLWAFSSIIMTSFGVNYYLSGLHSYAAGDPVPVPMWVYWIVLVLLTISVFAIFKYQKLKEVEIKQLVV